MGTGKTLFMTMRVQKHAAKGARVIANYGLNFPHEKANAALLMGLVENETSLQRCVLALTEIHVMLDARQSMKKRNITISYLILQTRKREVTLFYDSQSLQQVDVRLRQNTDYFVYCKKVAPNLFRYRIYTNSGKKVSTIFMDGRPYYGLYDTAETIVDFTA